VYTSADSVFQIACHEETFGLDRLYKLCEIARELVNDYNIGRVIARPFVGTNPKNFSRTGNRRDLTVSPPSATLLDRLVESGGEVISVGKIADIFAHRGITRKVKATGNAALFDATLDALRTAPDRSIVFTNFVDFDMLYGHRRDVDGYAVALEYFDGACRRWWRVRTTTIVRGSRLRPHLARQRSHAGAYTCAGFRRGRYAGIPRRTGVVRRHRPEPCKSFRTWSHGLRAEFSGLNRSRAGTG
jgi:hypothetical protein